MNDKSGSQSSQPKRNAFGQIPSSPHENLKPLHMEDVRQGMTAARTLLQANKGDEARAVLRQLVARAPEYEDPWLQLLALEPPANEEVALLEGFLRHHPQHRFAQAFRSRLHDMQIVVMLERNTNAEAPNSQPESAPVVTQRLGDYLIARHWATLQQVEQALQLQRELRQAGVERRLGTLLLMMGLLNQEQLAAALADAQSSGFGEFGSYLIRTGILTPAQVGQALAQQSAIAAQLDQKYLRQLATHRRMQSWIGRLAVAPDRKPVPRLGEILVSMGLLTVEQIEQILERREQDFQSSFE